MSSIASRWRAPVIGAMAGLAVAMAVAGESALASGGSAPSSRAVAKAAHVPGFAAAKLAARSQARASGHVPRQFFAAVGALVQAGTITPAQARIIDADIRAGSIDTDQLVARASLTSAQMQAVAERLGAVKRSLAPAAAGGAHRGSGKAPQG